MSLAQVSVDRVYIHFKAGVRPVQNVVVKNNGRDPLHIRMITDVIENPGTANENRVATKNLIASPKQFSLEPGGQRTVRLLLKKPFGEDEQVYRIKFIPQGAEDSGKRLQSSSQGKKTELTVFFSVGIILFADPKVVKKELVWNRSGGTITFENKGNVNVLLEEGKQCVKKEEDCKELKAKRLYPGNTWKLKVPGSRFVSYQASYNDGAEGIQIDP